MCRVNKYTTILLIHHNLLAPIPYRLLQLMKDSPSKVDHIGVKVRTANDAVQSIKQLRKEIVEIMSQLLCLAKSKNPKGMLPLCNEMVTKTRALLNIWEPSLVEEAFEFIENHRIIEEPDNSTLPMSPFRKITQQLGALDLKSPDLEDFATPMGPAPDLWPQIKPSKSGGNINTSFTNSFKSKSPSTTDINAIASVQHSVKKFNRTKLTSAISCEYAGTDAMTASLPVTCNLDAKNGNGGDNGLRFSETHFDVNGDVLSLELHPQPPVGSTSSDCINKKKSLATNGNSTYGLPNNGAMDADLIFKNQLKESKNEILLNSSEFDEGHFSGPNCSIVLGHNGAFLDTKVNIQREYNISLNKSLFLLWTQFYPGNELITIGQLLSTN